MHFCNLNIWLLGAYCQISSLLGPRRFVTFFKVIFFTNVCPYVYCNKLAILCWHMRDNTRLQALRLSGSLFHATLQDNPAFHPNDFPPPTEMIGAAGCSRFSRIERLLCQCTGIFCTQWRVVTDAQTVSYSFQHLFFVLRAKPMRCVRVSGFLRPSGSPLNSQSVAAASATADSTQYWSRSRALSFQICGSVV